MFTSKRSSFYFLDFQKEKKKKSFSLTLRWFLRSKIEDMEGSSTEEATRRGEKRRGKGKEKKGTKRVRTVDEDGKERILDNPASFFELPHIAQEKILTDFGMNPLDIDVLCEWARTHESEEAQIFILFICDSYNFWKRKYNKDFGGIVFEKLIRKHEDDTDLKFWKSMYEQAFFEAQKKFSHFVNTGDVAIVDRIVKSGININVRANNGTTALILASFLGHDEIVRLLIKAGADLDSQLDVDKETGRPVNKATALMVAVQQRHTTVVAMLIRYGANLDLQSIKGDTALLVAIKQNDIQIAVMLIRAGANLDRGDNQGITPLIHASGNGYSVIVSRLMRAGANLDLVDDRGVTALLRASEERHATIVMILVRAGANVDMQSIDGLTALMIASRRGQTDIVDQLIDAGATIDIRNSAGFTALAEAIVANRVDIVDRANVVAKLIRAGANVSVRVNITPRNSIGFSLLFLASKLGHTRIVRRLLFEGANVDFQDNDGSTSLMIASKRDHKEIVLQLLRARAKVNLQDLIGNTALILATVQGDVEIVKLLLRARVNPTLQDDDGRTALAWALLGNQTAMIAILDPATLEWLRAAHFPELIPPSRRLPRRNNARFMETRRQDRTPKTLKGWME